MSSSYNQAGGASKPQKKMQECNRCKAAGFPNQPIAFEKIGEDPATGKIKWKLVDENGSEHVHKGQKQFGFQKRKVVDIAIVTDVTEARKLLALGYQYEDSYPCKDIPHIVLVKRE